MTATARNHVSEIHVPDNFEYRLPIFQEIPQGLDETWTHGALVGGLLWLTEQADIARSYQCAADALIEKALEERLSWEVIYPALFLYRHALEITLKALFPDTAKTHQLDGLIERACESVGKLLSAPEADWVRDRLLEFKEVDHRSTAFRYAIDENGLNGKKQRDLCDKKWVDLRHLQQTMVVIFQLIEIMARNASTDKQNGV